MTDYSKCFKLPADGIPNAFRDNVYKQLGITPTAVAHRMETSRIGGEH